MSHFSVAVFHKPEQDVEDLLEPYYEEKECDWELAYTKKQAMDNVRNNWKLAKDYDDDELWELVKYEYRWDSYKIDEDGNIYSNFNKNAKWDWYSEGGRWSDQLKLKKPDSMGIQDDEANITSASVKLIDFSRDEERYKGALRFWDVVVGGQIRKPDEHIQPIYTKKYYEKRFVDREQFALECADFHTYAVVTPDGEWHEPCEMGWWGIAAGGFADQREWYKTYKEKWIDTADPEWILTIVDCHI